MKDQHNTEKIIMKIGGHGKYQIIITFILFIIAMGADFSVGFLTLMTSKPLVKVDINAKPEILNYDICKNYPDFKVLKFSLNWATLYKIQCDPLKTTILQSSFLIGAVIGLICVKIFAYKFYKENLIKFFIGLYCASFLLSIINHYESTVLMTFLHGLCQVPIFLMRNSIITEYINKEQRALFQTCLFFSVIVLGLLIIPIYSLIGQTGDWRFVYLSVSGTQMIALVALIYYLKVNPRNYLLKGEVDNAINSAIFVANQNKLIKNPNQDISVDQDKYTEEELKEWILENFSNRSKLLSTMISTTTEEDELYPKIPLIEDKEDYHQMSFIDILKLTFTQTHILLFFVILLMNAIFYTTVYENEKFTMEPDFGMSYMISVGSTAVLFFIASFLLNKIGRRFTILIFLILLMGLRVICFLKYSKIILYVQFALFSLSIALQVSTVVLVNESFDNRSRVTVQSLLLLFVKIIVSFVPSMTQYLKPPIMTAIYCCYVLLLGLVIFLIKETKGKDLKDS